MAVSLDHGTTPQPLAYVLSIVEVVSYLWWSPVAAGSARVFVAPHRGWLQATRLAGTRRSWKHVVGAREGEGSGGGTVTQCGVLGPGLSVLDPVARLSCSHHVRKSLGFCGSGSGLCLLVAAAYPQKLMLRCF